MVGLYYVVVLQVSNLRLRPIPQFLHQIPTADIKQSDITGITDEKSFKHHMYRASHSSSSVFIKKDSFGELWRILSQPLVSSLIKQRVWITLCLDGSIMYSSICCCSSASSSASILASSASKIARRNIFWAVNAWDSSLSR